MVQITTSAQTEFFPHVPFIPQGHTPTRRIPAYLYLKRKIYYFRYALTKERKTILGQTEIRLSLKTGYIREAVFRSGQIHRMLMTLLEGEIVLGINEIKSRLNRLLTQMTESRAARTTPVRVVLGPEPEGVLSMNTVVAYNKHLFRSKQLQEQLYRSILMDLEPDEGKRREILQEPFSEERFFSILTDWNAAFLQEEGYFSEEELRENRARIGKCLAQMEFEVNKFTQADERGDYTASLELAKLTASQAGQTEIPAPVTVHALPEESLPSLSLYEAIQKYLDAKAEDRAWKQTSAVDVANRLDFLRDIFVDKPLKDVSRDEVRGFRSTLVKLPPNHKRVKAYAGKSIQEILAMPPKKTLSVATVNIIMDAVSGFFEWCIAEGLLTANPAKGLQLKDDRLAVELRNPFSQQDLQTLFNHPRFAKMAVKAPATYWTSLIALFTGMRLEEVAQLHCSDLYQDSASNLWLFHLNDKGVDEDGFGKSLKNKNAVRIIPVHQTLIDLGLLEFHQNAVQQGKKRLFWMLTRTEKTVKYGKSPGKQFRTLVRVILPANEKQSFHSLRHTFADFYKQRNLQTDMFTRLYGHSLDRLAAKQYGGDFPPEVLYREVIEKLDYGVDFAKLTLKGKSNGTD